VLRSI